MTDVNEQRICIKFCFKLGKTAEETHKMLKEAFGDNALRLTQTHKWIKRLKNGRMSLDDDERSGRPSTGTTTENVAKVREAILENQRRTIHDICDIVKLSYETCQRILTDELNMRRIAAKFVSRLLTNDQREHRVAVCTELKEETENDPNFFFTITTGNEFWVYGYDPELKQQSPQWKTPNSPRPKKAR
jgi:hypothetical protein